MKGLKNPKIASINYNSSQGEAFSYTPSEAHLAANLNKNSQKEGINRPDSGFNIME